MCAGVIERDCTGEVEVILHNHGYEDFKVQVGMRIAQLILEKTLSAETLELTTTPSASRGEDGFGSAGVAALGESDIGSSGGGSEAVVAPPGQVARVDGDVTSGRSSEAIVTQSGGAGGADKGRGGPEGAVQPPIGLCVTVSGAADEVLSYCGSDIAVRKTCGRSLVEVKLPDGDLDEHP